MFPWGGTRAFFDKSISKIFLSIIIPNNVANVHFFAVEIFWKVFLYLTLLITVDKPMTKSTRVEHPSYHLDELRSIRMNMKSNTGYVSTKPGDRALRSPWLQTKHLIGDRQQSF